MKWIVSPFCFTETPDQVLDFPDSSVLTEVETEVEVEPSAIALVSSPTVQLYFLLWYTPQSHSHLQKEKSTATIGNAINVQLATISQSF